MKGGEFPLFDLYPAQMGHLVKKMICEDFMTPAAGMRIMRKNRVFFH